MIKKALVTLLSSAILATTVVSGVVTTPMVAYAKETNIIKVTKEDCVTWDELEQRGIHIKSVDNCTNIFKASDTDTYFLALSESDEDGNMLLYQLDGSAVIETSELKYTVDYDGTSYSVNITSFKAEAEEEKKENEKAKINKWISDMVVCKHQSAGNVTLSAPEKKGTLTVTKADIRTATKLDMMLKSKKAVTVKIKASSKSKAVNQFKSLRKLAGHANTYGVLPWIEADQGIPFTEKIDSYKFKKSGSFYTVSISKSISKNYTYLCKAYENAFKRAEKRNTGYHFVEGTHLCDCSDLAKVRMIDEIELHSFRHAGSREGAEKMSCSDFKALSGDKVHYPYVCEGLAKLAQKIGYASGIDSEYKIIDNYTASGEPHAIARFVVKDGNGRSTSLRLDNGVFTYSGSSTDGKAISHILGIRHMRNGGWIGMK